MTLQEFLLKVRIDAEDLDKILGYTWYIKSNGYIAADFSKNGKRTHLYLHRHLVNAPKGKVVDHINGDIKDNRKSNLRVVSWSMNLANSHKDRRRAGKYRYVYYDKNSKNWDAKYKIDHKTVWVGTFDTAEEAHVAVVASRKERGLSCK